MGIICRLNDEKTHHAPNPMIHPVVTQREIWVQYPGVLHEGDNYTEYIIWYTQTHLWGGRSTVCEACYCQYPQWNEKWQCLRLRRGDEKMGELDVEAIYKPTFPLVWLTFTRMSACLAHTMWTHSANSWDNSYTGQMLVCCISAAQKTLKDRVFNM